MADASATLLLVDDHPLFHAGLLSVLQARRPGYTLLSAEDSASGLEAIRYADIDLVLIDIVLPDIDGFDALARFQLAAPGVPRVLISGRDDPATVARARRSGASGFISKSWSPGALVGAIDKVLEGECLFGRPEGQEDSGGGLIADGADSLTLRQREVLSLLVEGKCNKDIGRRLEIADRTVRAHLTEIFHMLGVQSRVQAILEAQRIGLSP